MAKKPEAKAPAKAAPKPAAKPVAKPIAKPVADPLAGKSTDERKDILEGAKAKDIRSSGGLVVDEKVKAEALALMASHAAAVQKWRDAKRLKTELSVVLELREAGKAIKHKLNLLYGKHADSVQAAETAFAAKK